MTSLIDEILALDLLTLRAHTEGAGDSMDPAVHAQRIRESLAISTICVVQRSDKLVAYAMFNPQDGGSWFVRGFNTHPDHRNAGVMKELFRRLGFRATRENDKAVEFFASLEELAHAPYLAQVAN